MKGALAALGLLIAGFALLRLSGKRPAAAVPELAAPESARFGQEGPSAAPAPSPRAPLASGAPAAPAAAAPEPAPEPQTPAPARAAASPVALLEDVLRRGDDNDPRLDAAFDWLDARAKAAFRARYAKLPEEQRNKRGTVVYLLGRNLKAPEDWAFLRAVVAEPPCRSLADCRSGPKEDEGPGAAVTLAYPALVALKQAERGLKDRALRDEALALVRAAKASPSALVAERAAELEKRF